MKPLHVGLLVIGAALAGGVAVKMTQPLAFRAQPPIVAARPQAVAELPPPAVARDQQVPQENRTPSETGTARKPGPFRRREEAVASRPRNEAPAVPLQPYRSVAVPAETAQPVPPVAASSPAAIPAPAAPEPAVASPVAPEPPAQAAAAAPRQVLLPRGLTVKVRLDEALSTARAAAGDTFQASLFEPVIADGLIIGERGARVTGRIVDSRQSTGAGGRAALTLALSTIETADGQRITVATEAWLKQGDFGGSGDAVTIGGGAALGAIVGAMAGGGKGAAIGAGIGGGIGIGAVAAGRARPVEVPSETILSFKLAAGVLVKERPF